LSEYILLAIIIAVSIVITHWLKQACSAVTSIFDKAHKDEMRDCFKSSVADEVEEGNMRAYYRQKTDPLNKDNYFRH
jgi:hypothetical protein